ncbi:hypothetical protein T492DRAFT_1126073 [Pavlovales sp. CCMP2436]|nr:hypothetical protein T492DRAFT_1126073 [Pavlovales sp. CCMP2436]
MTRLQLSSACHCWRYAVKRATVARHRLAEHVHAVQQVDLYPVSVVVRPERERSCLLIGSSLLLSARARHIGSGLPRAWARACSLREACAPGAERTRSRQGGHTWIDGQAWLVALVLVAASYALVVLVRDELIEGQYSRSDSGNVGGKVRERQLAAYSLPHPHQRVVPHAEHCAIEAHLGRAAQVLIDQPADDSQRRSSESVERDGTSMHGMSNMSGLAQQQHMDGSGRELDIPEGRRGREQQGTHAQTREYYMCSQPKPRLPCESTSARAKPPRICPSSAVQLYIAVGPVRYCWINISPSATVLYFTKALWRLLRSLQMTTPRPAPSKSVLITSGKRSANFVISDPLIMRATGTRVVHGVQIPMRLAAVTASVSETLALHSSSALREQRSVWTAKRMSAPVEWHRQLDSGNSGSGPCRSTEVGVRLRGGWRFWAAPSRCLSMAAGRTPAATRRVHSRDQPAALRLISKRTRADPQLLARALADVFCRTALDRTIFHALNELATDGPATRFETSVLAGWMQYRHGTHMATWKVAWGLLREPVFARFYGTASPPSPAHVWALGKLTLLTIPPEDLKRVCGEVRNSAKYAGVLYYDYSLWADDDAKRAAITRDWERPATGRTTSNLDWVTTGGNQSSSGTSSSSGWWMRTRGTSAPTCTTGCSSSTRRTSFRLGSRALSSSPSSATRSRAICSFRSSRW